MRTKFLSIIASFFIFSIAITSCLDSNDEYELSSDDIITAFTLDTIYGVTYKFTINQYGGTDGKVGLIYNVDSVPFSADTIINKILIKNIATNGYVTSGKNALEDTLFNIKDSLDLSKTMDEPLTIRVRSYDGNHIKEYRIEVRRHKTDPDSLVWGGEEQEPVVESFSGGAVTTDQETKTISLGDDIQVYTSDNTNIILYSKNENWASSSTNLPLNTRLSSILTFEGVLYAATEDGKVLSSTTGKNWTQVTTDGTAVETLLTTFYGDETDSNGNPIDELISGIAQYQEEVGGSVQTVRRFASATFTGGVMTWAKGNIVPDEFPKTGISATKSFKTSTGMQRAVLVGASEDDEATKTIPWFSIDGSNWAPMESAERYSIKPAMKHPSIIYYGKKYYAFGDGFSTMYTSINGLVWEEVKKKFLFPSNEGTPIFKDRGGYSMVVDKDNYIWLVWGKGASYTDEVWKGKLNKLGFIIQD